MGEGMLKMGEDAKSPESTGSEWDALSGMSESESFDDWNNIDWGDLSEQEEQSEEESSDGLYIDVEVPFKGQLEALEEPHTERTAEESEQKEGGVVEWEKIKEVFNDDRYEILGHGTTSTERADAILSEGLHVGDDSGYFARDTDIFSNFAPLGNNDPDAMRGAMDHWPHKNSRQIVLYRIPWQYKTAPGSSVAAYVPFYTGNTKAGTFDKEYAFGWYDAADGAIHLNPDYHGDLDNEKDVAYLEREKERIEKHFD